MPGFFIFSLCVFSGFEQIARKLYLVRIEFHAGVAGVEWNDLLDERMFMVNKYFEVIIAQDVQINFVTIVPDRHYKGAVLVKELDLLAQRQLLIISPCNHITT